MIDFALIVDSLPVSGGDTPSSQRLVTAGGGFNVMSAARRQGASALYAGQLGMGPFADIARGALTSEGIEPAVAPRGDVDLGVCVVLVDATGERTFVTSPGAELTLTGDELDAVTVVHGDVVYVSGYNVVYPGVTNIVSRWLLDLPSGVTVAFDPGPRAGDIDAATMAGVLERTDWLLCNAAEARQVGGCVDVVDAALALRDRWGFQRVVVRDGAEGCVGATHDAVYRAPGYDARVVDTNGAGDVHNGVVIAELLNATIFEESLRRANAAAAIAISSLGPATCPTRDRVDALLAAQPREVTTVDQK